MENNQYKTSQLLYWLHAEIIIFWTKYMTLTSLLSFYFLNVSTRKFKCFTLCLLDIASLDILPSLHGPWGISISHYIVKNLRLRLVGLKGERREGELIRRKKLALCLKLYGFMLKCTCICKYLFLWLHYKSSKYHVFHFLLLPNIFSLIKVTFLF